MIVIADNDDSTRTVLTCSLERSGYAVEPVADGQLLWPRLEAGGVELLILDLRMPGLDGMSVLKTIKERWPESEVVVITGCASLETVKEAVQLGACDYLSKPVGPDEVIHAANGALTRKKWALHEVRTEH